jgi:hypothetical protein
MDQTFNTDKINFSAYTQTGFRCKTMQHSRLRSPNIHSSRVKSLSTTPVFTLQ